MAGYRFANPNYSAMGGTIGSALDKAAGSVDNIAIAMMRNMKSPEEKALMQAQMNQRAAEARKLNAEAAGAEQVVGMRGDPLGTLASAMFGGDPSAPSNMRDAMAFADNALDGPVPARYVSAVPQIRRDARTVALSNMTGDKNIGDIMKLVMQQGQMDDIAAKRLLPQDAAVNNYVTGASPNRPIGIDQGLSVEYGSGKIGDTSVSLAGNARDKAAANASNAQAGASSALAKLRNAETTNEINGTTGRTGGGGASGVKGSETPAQRMKREAMNEETARARERVSAAIQSGMTPDQIRMEPSTSDIRRDLVSANRALVGVDDPDYAKFSELFADKGQGSIASAITAVQAMRDEPGRLWGNKYDESDIKKALSAQFPELSPEQRAIVLQRSRTAAPATARPASRLPDSGSPAQQVAAQQPQSGQQPKIIAEAKAAIAAGADPAKVMERLRQNGINPALVAQ